LKEFGRNNLLRLQADKGIKAKRLELLLNNDDIINEEEADSESVSDEELEIGSEESFFFVIGVFEIVQYIFLFLGEL
jgi:hypothetical protein